MADLHDTDYPLSYLVTIALTIAILTVSTVYTVKNILRIWRKGKISRKPSAADSNDGVINDGKDFSEEPRAKSLIDEVKEGNIDPLDYCEHIQSEVKKAKIRATTKQLEETLTKDQLKQEKELEREQLAAIYKLMETQNDKFGIKSMDDIGQQMKLYR